MKGTIRAATALAFLAVSVTAAAAFGTGDGGMPAAGGIQDRGEEAERGRPGDRCGRHGRGGRHGLHGAKRRLVTGESKVQVEGGFATVNVDVGEVTAVDGSTVTIERADGESVSATASDETRVCRDGSRVEVGAIQAGDTARITRVTRDGETQVRGIHARSADGEQEGGAEPAGLPGFEPPGLAA